MQHLRRSSALALAGLLAATAVPACRGPRQPTDAPTTSPGTGSPSAPVGLTPAATLVTSTPDAGSASPTIATGEPSPTPSPATTAPPDGLPAIGWAAQPSDFAPFDSITETVRTERGLVAVGSRDSGDVQHAAGWLSSDGRSWAAVELPGSEFAALEDVVGGPSVIVAVGFSHAGDATRPAIWASLDGTSWTRAAGDLGRGELVAGSPPSATKPSPA